MPQRQVSTVSLPKSPQMGRSTQRLNGTGMGRDFESHKKIPLASMPYGQALAMLAIVEWERAQRGSQSRRVIQMLYRLDQLENGMDMEVRVRSSVWVYGQYACMLESEVLVFTRHSDAPPTRTRSFGVNK